MSGEDGNGGQQPAKLPSSPCLRRRNFCDGRRGERTFSEIFKTHGRSLERDEDFAFVVPFSRLTCPVVSPLVSALASTSYLSLSRRRHGVTQVNFKLKPPLKPGKMPVKLVRPIVKRSTARHISTPYWFPLDDIFLAVLSENVRVRVTRVRYFAAMCTGSD